MKIKQTGRHYSPTVISGSTHQHNHGGSWLFKKKAPITIVFLLLLMISTILFQRIFLVGRYSANSLQQQQKEFHFLLKSEQAPITTNPSANNPKKPTQPKEKPVIPTPTPETKKKRESKSLRNFMADDQQLSFSDTEFANSLLGKKNLTFTLHKELTWPLIINNPANDGQIPPVKTTTDPVVATLSILKEKESYMYSILPITHFSSYPLPKTENDLFESLQEKPAMIESVMGMCKTRAFYEYLYPHRVYLDNASVNLKWMFCRNEFFETKKSTTFTELHPCADFMFILRSTNVHITRSFCREYCMGFIDRTMNKYYHFQPWFSAPPRDDNQPITLEKAAYGWVSPYIDAFGHFSSESLYYIVYLLRMLPKDVKILACTAPVCAQYYEYLDNLEGDPFELNWKDPDPMKRRIIPLNPGANSYFIKELFVPSSYPTCQDEATKIYSRESVLLTQEPFLKPFYEEQAKTPRQRHILVIDRSDATMRTLSNHAQLVQQLKAQFPQEIVLEFLSAKVKGLKNVIDMFFYAKVIVAPHGAGLTHLLWCQPGTKVIEIGFDQGEHPFPSAYYGLSVAGRLDYYFIIGKGSLLGKWLEAPLPSTMKLTEKAVNDYNARFSNGNNGLELDNERTRKEMIFSFKRFVSKYANLLDDHPQNKILFKNLLKSLELPSLEAKKKFYETRKMAALNEKIHAIHYIMDITTFFDNGANFKKIFLLRQICLGLIRRQIEEKIERINENSQNHRKTTKMQNSIFLTLITEKPNEISSWLTREFKQYFEDLPNIYKDIKSDKKFEGIQLIPDFINFSPLSEDNRIRIHIKNSPDTNFVLRNLQIRDAQYLPSNFQIKYSILNFDTYSGAGLFSTDFALPGIANMQERRENSVDYLSFVEDCNVDERKGVKSVARSKILENSKFAVTFSKKTKQCLETTYGMASSRILYFEREPFGVGTVFKPLSDQEVENQMKSFLPLTKPFFLNSNCAHSFTWSTWEAVLTDIQTNEGHQIDYLAMNCYTGTVPDKFVFPIINHNQMGLLFTKSLGLVELGDEITMNVMECIASGNPVILSKELKTDPFFEAKSLPKGIYFVDKNNESEIKTVIRTLKELTREERVSMALGLFEFIKAKNLSFVNTVGKMFSELYERQLNL